MKQKTAEGANAEIQIQTFAPIPAPPPGTPPDRPHPMPVKRKAATSLAAAAAQLAIPSDPCTSLTRVAIQAPIDKINDSISKAVSDNAKNGNPSANYPSAPPANLGNLTTARDKLLVLRDWLSASGMLDPYVSNIVGAYNIHEYAGAAMDYLLNARHWAMISAVYHQSQDAQDSFDLTTQAIVLLGALAPQGGRCYMNAFGPFK